MKKDRKIKRFFKRNRDIFVCCLAGVLFICILIVLVNTMISFRHTDTKINYVSIKRLEAFEKIEEEEAAPSPKADVPVATQKPKEYSEEEVYTFLQGPKSWDERRDWSGSWGHTYYDGSSFGAFGCGLCCLANVYSTQSRYRCTPIDVYRFAKRQTYYGGGGAIAWEYMESILEKLGFSCSLQKKPRSYQAFQEQMVGAKCSIVLVSSDNSTCYWQDTPGHYVTIFMYDEEKDMVFLADSGNPNHNRHWVSLRKIYKSLKTASEWQYLKVGGYNSEKDTWHHKKIEGNWIRPDYISPS